MTRLLAERFVIVTGAGSGNGRAAALVLSREGATIALAGRTLSDLQATFEIIPLGGGDGICVRTDVSQSADVRALVDATVENFGRVDCAVNNSGVDGPLTPTADDGEAAFDEVIAINLKGVWNCLRYQIPAMLKAGGGSIVNLSSALGEAAQYNMPA